MSKQLCVRLPSTVQDRVKTLVSQGIFLNQSDFVRDAIRSKLLEVEAQK